MTERNDWVLLVEDNEDDVLLLQRAMTSLTGAPRLVVARDGVEALEVLRGGGPCRDAALAPWPALVMLDINLPRLSGLEVLEWLRAQEFPQLLRVVMLTTSDDERDIRRAYEAGASSYVRKPVGFEQFKVAVGHIGRYWVGLNYLPFKLLT